MADPTKPYTEKERKHIEMLRKRRERLEQRDKDKKKLKRLIGAAVVAASFLSCTSTSTRTQHPQPLATGSVSTATQAVAPPLSATTPADIHGGEVFQVADTVYWIGDSYGCGFTLGAPGNHYCGEVGYSADSLSGPWKGPVLLFDPAPWQSRCATPAYGCFRPHVVWDSNTADWRLWLNVNFAYSVFKADSPLGPYTYIADAQLSIGSRYGDETLFIDGDTGYAAYTVVGAANAHNIAVEQLDSTLTHGTGHAAQVSIPQWVESPSLFLRNGQYYLAYSDPICAFCSSAGTSYARGSSPLGPWSEIRHSITKTSCNGQPASVNLIDGEWLYQSDLWTGSMNETDARQHWEQLHFVGNDIAPLTCR